MFGREFSKNPEVLFSSFAEMKKNYKKKISKKPSRYFLLFSAIYIRLFGVPEIGFQLRSLYFKSFVSKFIKLKSGKIIDAGSGIGSYAFWLSRKFPKAQVVGLEIDKEKIKFASEFSEKLKLDNVKFDEHDLTANPKQKKAKLIITIDVLEHIKDYRQALKNLHKMLDSGGLLYIHVPQENQKRIFRTLENWHHEDHVREGFEPVELKDNLQKIGFSVIETRQTFGFFGKFAWEMNHVLLERNFIVAGLLYPLLYFVGILDLLTHNKNGLGEVVIARKK